MTIIHSCTSDSFSGLEHYVLELITWQYQQGKSVELYCREKSELEKRARERGIPVWTIGAYSKPGPLLWARMAEKWNQRLKQEVKLHMHAGGELWFHFPWLMRRPRNLTKTVLHFHIWINHKKKDLFHRAVYSGVDEIWTSSETARAHLASLLPVKRERIRVVKYGRDVQGILNAPTQEWKQEQRKKLKLRSQDVLGVCVSRLEPIKGVGELFEAFLQIAPKYSNAHLALIGDASPNNPEAENFAKNLKKRHRELPQDIQSRLHLMGYIPDALKVMAAADFYVLPSYEECMSLAMLDALILGLPVLGTNSGGTPSVVRPQETGMLVPPKDPKALALALEVLYAQPELCSKLGEGAKSLGQSFNQEEIFHQIWDWYNTGFPAQISVK